MLNPQTAKLIGAGRLIADPEWSLSTHTHPFWEFVYFVNGTGRIDTPEATLWPLPYHLVVYPPGLPHAEWSDPIQPEETIFLSFDIPSSSPRSEHLFLPDPKGEFGWLVRRILEETAVNGLSGLALAYGSAFVHLVERTYETGQRVAHDSLDQAVQHLYSNYSSPITLDDLANIACTSKTYFVHTFHQKMGMSPLRYLQQVRIDASKRLLLTTREPINRVASEVGFEDPLYFSRVFHKATGQSPSQFRNGVH